MVTLFGLLLVAPTLGLLLPAGRREHLLPYLPSTAGASFFSAHPSADSLSATAGLLVLVAWVVVALLGAAVLVARRDA